MNASIVYWNGEYVEKSRVWISPDERGFLFGDGVYEYLVAEDGRLFAEEPHWARLARSLREIRLGGVETGLLAEAARELLRRNRLETGWAGVYLQVTRGAAPRRHAFPGEGTPPTVFAEAKRIAPPVRAREEGVEVVVRPDVRWGRCDIKSVNLLPNVLANQEAAEAGAYEAVLVRDGVVTEGSHTSIAAVAGGVLRTHPLSPAILPGVTRALVLALARAEGLPVEERALTVEEFRQAEEVMIWSTSNDIVPVVRVEGQPVGTGRPGPVTRRLQALWEEGKRVASGEKRT